MLRTHSQTISPLRMLSKNRTKNPLYFNMIRNIEYLHLQKFRSNILGLLGPECEK